MRVAVLGASGKVGQFAVARLSQEHSVVALSRSGRAPAYLPDNPGVSWKRCDLTDASPMPAALEGCDALVHAAFFHEKGRYRGGEGDDPNEFWRVNFDGTRRLYDAARQSGVRRTVFLSSRAVFGESGPPDLRVPIRDKQRPFPDTVYGELKVRSEALMSEYREIGLCCLRPTGIFGVTLPIREAKWAQLVSKRIAGIKPSTASNQAHTEVHGDDVARAIELLLTANDEHQGQSFNCSDVALSEAQLVNMLMHLEVADDRIIDALPPSLDPHHPMDSTGLRELGWRPGGLRQVLATLRQLKQALENG